MTTYRSITSTPISKNGQPPYIVKGDLIQTGDFSDKVIRAFLEKGIIAEVHMPPLAELPGWELRAARLLSLGVILVSDLLDATPETIKAIRVEFKYKTNAPIIKWQEEALEWLKPTKPIQSKRG